MPHHRPPFSIDSFWVITNSFAKKGGEGCLQVRLFCPENEVNPSAARAPVLRPAAAPPSPRGVRPAPQTGPGLQQCLSLHVKGRLLFFYVLALTLLGLRTPKTAPTAFGLLCFFCSSSSFFFRLLGRTQTSSDVSATLLLFDPLGVVLFYPGRCLRWIAPFHRGSPSQGTQSTIHPPLHCKLLLGLSVSYPTTDLRFPSTAFG